MHFHLPKPLHGWREFVGEIAIIVIGVLIALGAEQVVEAAHWRHEVEAERHSLLQEARDTLEGVAFRQTQQSCVDRRLHEVRTVLERHARGEPLGLTGNIGYPQVRWATRGSWQIALAGQALSHMEHDEKLLFSDVFGALDYWDRVREMERADWYALSLLNTPDLLTDQNWSSITAAYNEASMRNEHIRLLAPFLLAKRVPGIETYRVGGDLSSFRRFGETICQPVLGAASTAAAGSAGLGTRSSRLRPSFNP